MPQGVRVVIALILAGVAGWSLWISYGPLHNLWVEDGGDSGAVVYLAFGLPFVAASLLCLAGAWFVLRQRR